MCWADLCKILRKTAPEQAQAIESAILARMAGERLTIPRKRRHTPEEIDSALSAASHDVGKAAQRLGVNKATLYRKMQQRLVR